MMMPRPSPSSSRLLRSFFNSHNFFIMEKWPVAEFPEVKVETLKFQQFYLMKFQVSTLTSGNSATGHFSIMKKLWELKNVLSNLEEEGQGQGIIMGVTRLLLLGPFYTIQSNFMYFFAHDCSSYQKNICSEFTHLHISTFNMLVDHPDPP